MDREGLGRSKDKRARSEAGGEYTGGMGPQPARPDAGAFEQSHGRSMVAFEYSMGLNAFELEAGTQERSV